MSLSIALLLESDGPGGAERMVLQLAEGLRERGHAVSVVGPARGCGWLAAESRTRGFEPATFMLRRPVDWRCVVELVELLRRRQIDVLHSHEFTAAVYGAWAAWWAGRAHLITMHGGRYYAGRLQRRLALRAAGALSGALVAVSEVVARRLAADLWLPVRRIPTIANGVRLTPAARSTLRTELRLGADDRLILAVGNLYPVKGHHYVVDALALLRDRHPRAHVAIAGRGELANALAAHAQAQGVGDRVHLLGLRGDVPNLLAGADIFAHPSLSEGLPLALLEAMFAGRAIVASDVGEVPTVLAHGEAGLLVPPGDAPALAAALDRLLTSPDQAEALGGHAARRAAAEYAHTGMVERYLTLYNALPPRRARRAPTGAAAKETVATLK